MPLRGEEDLVARVHPTTVSQGAGQVGGRIFSGAFCEEEKKKKRLTLCRRKGVKPWDGGLEGDLHSSYYRFIYNYKMVKTL